MPVGDTVKDGGRKMEAPYRGEFRKFASQVLALGQVQGSPRSSQRPFRENDKKEKTAPTKCATDIVL